MKTAMRLEPANERLLTAAQGYLELGLPLDANEEIESMDADVRNLRQAQREEAVTSQLAHRRPR